MKKIQVNMIMTFDREKDGDLFNLFSPLSLLLASDQGKDNNAVLNTIKEIEFDMNKGKKYRITIEELN